ncbi:amidase [Enterovirga sp.]|uniref:amidase n=1 Tax=Enterovirga sp. TaxID=2026350 RepID=UPI002C18F7B1|nr:amidase [Enterovirga sp.]HMO27708.1 amidase [Enterovirga sp.]
MPDDIGDLSAVSLAQAIRARKLSPVEVVGAALARAERLQPAFNCFIEICADRAMREARLAEKAVMVGDALGALHGLPFSAKDLVTTEGVRTTFGTVMFKDNVPKEDAVSIRRLRDAGAILIGKTTTPEFGSKPFTDSPLFGRTRNAWSAGRTSGGSSGGAAVATAIGIAPLAVATDGGGSTRIPAAANGVVGIKQTIGLIPHDSAQDAIGNQTYVTPTTRNVADTALMLQVMAGEASCDPWSVGQSRDFPVPVPHQGALRGCRLRMRLTPNGEPVSDEVARVFGSALARLGEAGARVEEMPALGIDIEPVWRIINHTNWRARFAALVERDPAGFSATFRRQLDSAASYAATEFQEAMFRRTALFRRVQELLEGADLLIMPTLTRTALDIDGDIFDKIEIDGRTFDSIRAHWYPWTMPFNMTGHPAISIPCGLASDGLPVGMQIVARHRQDAYLLRVAAAIEAILPIDARPALP